VPAYAVCVVCPLDQPHAAKKDIMEKEEKKFCSPFEERDMEEWRPAFPEPEE